MNRILIIHKGQFDVFPPLLSVKRALNDLEYQVDVLTTKNENTALFNKNENCYIIPNGKSVPLFSFLLWYFQFLITLRTLTRKNYKYIWIEGGDTLALFGKLIKVENKDRYILQISELYDKLPLYKSLIGWSIKKFNKIVMPEINRAYIFKVWFNLPVLPMVLPNKPNYQNKEIDSKSPDLLSTIEKIKKFAGDRKIILYQGLIATDRKFPGVVDFVNTDNEYCLVLLGPDNGYLKEINNSKANIFYAGFVAPPLHLEITKMANICLMAYDTSSLNKIYCAPNKIWEYAQERKPILSQFLPGIQGVFQEYDFGVCCDVKKVNSVRNAVIKLEEDYKNKSESAGRFFQSLDYLAAMNKILN